ncbi:ESX-1 secretion-associated protein EspJ [Mycobacterium uberis]|uniref:ESX-1 secretion-associated protein EspJ n=1 Tax=Mycobacterium uberis TaxID=2162698 RepID=A0A3E1HL27_9MYCO|nr:hypothetical protein [Mycobacterium uberis]RFD27201.1 ESX-1 secretion-associated protein EspJ [Mycobacterium uberis]
MSESLAVDPSVLTTAGAKLGNLVFPVPPSPIRATGTDSLSSAINTTMPGIEALVFDSLTAVKAALFRTASNISAAANVYIKADQALSDNLKQFLFGSAGNTFGTSAASEPTGQLGGGEMGMMTASLPSKLSPEFVQIGSQIQQNLSVLAPRLAATVPQLAEMTSQADQMAQQISSMMQTVIPVVQQTGSQSTAQGGSAPVQLVSETRKDSEDTDSLQQSSLESPLGVKGHHTRPKSVGTASIQVGAGAAGGTPTNATLGGSPSASHEVRESTPSSTASKRLVSQASSEEAGSQRTETGTAVSPNTLAPTSL